MYYILKKKIDYANILSKKNNFIKTKKIFNYNNFKINKNKLLLTNKFKLKIIFYNIKNK